MNPKSPLAAAVLGDALLELTVAHAEPMRHAGDTPGRIAVGIGGQGANVAVRLARRGIDARLVTVLGSDFAGDVLRAALREEGVAIHVQPAVRSGAVLSLLDEAGERSMLSDRIPLEPGPLGGLLDAVGAVDWSHISGYVLRQPDGAEIASLVRSRTGSGPLSIAGGSLADRAHERAAFQGALRSLRPDVLVLARGEAEVLAGSDGDPLDLLARMTGAWAWLAVVTDGASGAAAAWGEASARTVPAPARDGAVDATGAGDAFVAAMIAVLIGRAWPPPDALIGEALSAAAAMGAAVAGEMGAQAAVPGERRG